MGTSNGSAREGYFLAPVDPRLPERYWWLLEDTIKLSNTGEGGWRNGFGPILKDEVVFISLAGCRIRESVRVFCQYLRRA